MKAIYDYATNASCPQRPAWQISPVGYKWAQAVLLNRKQAHPCNVKHGEELVMKPEEVKGKLFHRNCSGRIVFFRHTGKLLSAGVRIASNP